ncbi:hypothetical protein PIB30_056057 [Stylosanthes scabra]|uniref:Uncharacterized protein n=1 Tax=Stylosanthes scabra TaxID=79078 RepID=A0ABU6ZI04_9FABA|nr:hypothetical protein [Stylosanthes scabra]
MEFERYGEWNVWQKQRNTREWTTEKYRRFTTKDGALKAIAEMDNINLRGNKVRVKEAYYRGDYDYRMGYHAELINTTGRVVKKVNGREFDPTGELVINIRCEDTVEENSVLGLEEILDEWSFLSYNKNLSVCATVEKDLSIKQVIKNNNKEEHQESRNVLLQVVLNEWDKEGLQQRVRKVLEETLLGQNGTKEDEGKNFDEQSEGDQYEWEDDFTSNYVHSLDLDETLNHMWEVHCQGSKIKKKKKKRITSEIIRNKVTNDVQSLGNPKMCKMEMKHWTRRMTTTM